MRNEHSLKIALIPYPDGSYIVEFSYWLPVEGGHFKLIGNRTIAPSEAAIEKVISSLIPYATYAHKPYSGENLTAQ